MKLSLILAAIAVSAQAFNPKKTPESMKGKHELRWTLNESDKKEGTDAIDTAEAIEDGARAICLRSVQMFDSYCHQYKVGEGSAKAPKYADYTDESGSCNGWAETNEKAHCLAQDCMFEYCLYKRDEHYADCEALADEWEEAIADQGVVCSKEKKGTCLKTATVVDFRGSPEKTFMKVSRKHNKRPGWGQVYNYGNMHNELNSNTGGDFVSTTCDTYYEVIEEEDY